VTQETRGSNPVDGSNKQVYTCKYSMCIMWYCLFIYVCKFFIVQSHLLFATALLRATMFLYPIANEGLVQSANERSV
jgi:hypothetical protein